MYPWPSQTGVKKAVFLALAALVLLSLFLIQWKPEKQLLPWLSLKIGISLPDFVPVQGSSVANDSYFDYPTDKDKYLIYVCRGKDVCGGLADRQRGIASSFLLAIVTKRRFGILFDTPCKISHVYQPLRYNWIISPDVLTNKTSRLVVAIDGGNPAFYLIRSSDFNVLYPEDVIYLRTNNVFQWQILENPMYKARVPVWANHPWHIYLKNAWEILMTPTPAIQSRLETVLESLGYANRTKPLVCLHVRIGRSAIPTDSNSFNDVTKLGPVWDLVSSYVNNGSQLFLATDSTDVRNISRTKYLSGHHEAAQEIVHIDQMRDAPQACQGFQDALLDQLVLSYGDVLILTRSGFGETAAVLRGSNSSLYKFVNDRLKVESIDTVYADGHKL